MSDSYLSPLPEGEPALPPTPPYSLFDSTSVALATFFGSPLAGGILMMVNYRRLGEETSAAISFLAGLALTILAVLSGKFLPSTGVMVIPIVLVIAMRSAAQTLQGPAVQQHQSQGGKLVSRWAAFGIGVAGMFVVFTGIFVLFIAQQVASTPTSSKVTEGSGVSPSTSSKVTEGSVAPLSASSKVTIGTKDLVYYSGSATNEDAQSLGEKLKSIGYFTDKGVNVLLSKDKGGAVVSFVVQDGVWNQPKMVSAFVVIGGQIAPSVGGYPMKMRLIDTQRVTKKETTLGRVIIGTKDEVYYYGAATEADAQALGQALKTGGFMQDQGVSVLLSKEDGTTISFIVREGFWNKPEIVASFETLVRQAAPSVGGLPIKVHLIDTSFEIRKEVLVQ